MKMQKSLDLQQLLNFLAKHGPNTQAELEIGLKRPLRTLWGKLKSAVEAGYIRKDANARPHKYRVTGKGKRLLENAKQTKPMIPNQKMPKASDDELERVILRVRNRGRNSYPKNNETALINHVVHPILKALGWNHENPDDVLPHYSIPGGNPRSASGNREVDMALLHRHEPKVFVEVKNLDERLTDWETKLQECCRNAKTKTETPIQIGVLTNGFAWDLYLDEFSSGRNNFALVEKIIIDKGEPAKIAGKLKRFLHKPRVLNGTADRAFKQALRETSRQAQIKQDLDEALTKILKNADEWLQRSLKRELLASLGKARLPSDYGDELSRFAKARAEEISRSLPAYSPDDKLLKVRRRNTAATHSDKSAPPEQKPSRFYFLDKEFEFNSWAGAAKTICAELHRQDPSLLRRLIDEIPSNFALSNNNNKSANWTSRAHLITDTSVLIYLNMYASSIKKLCHKVCEVLNLPAKDGIRFE